MELGRYGLRDIMDLQMIDYVTGEPYLYVNYASSVENEWTAEQTYVRGGRGNPRRIVFNDSKDSTLTVSTQIFSMKELSMLAGSQVVSQSGMRIYEREELTVVEDTSATEPTFNVTLSKEPTDKNGDTATDAEDVGVVLFSNGVEGQTVTVDSIDASTKTVTVSGDNVSDGTGVAVYYQWATTEEAHSMTITADSFPQYMKLIGDSFFEDELQGKTTSGQLIYYKAKPQPNMTLSFAPSGDPTTLEMAFDIMPVRQEGEDKMADFIMYNDNDNGEQGTSS